MGLFDTLKDMGNALGDVVNTAVNDYKEKKAYEEAEKELKESIAEDQYLFFMEHIEDASEETLQLIMKTELLFYDSFKKEGYASSVDIMDAIAAGEEIGSWAEEYNNTLMIETAYESFYKKYVEDAMDSEWYKNSMEPFYESDAKDKLVSILNSLLTWELPDIAMGSVKDKYGDSTDGLRAFLEEKKYDFYDPTVVWALNSFDDDKVVDNLDHYERKCLKKYTNIVRNTRLAKYGMGTDSKQILLEKDRITCCVDIVDNCFCYMPVSFKDVKTISDLQKYTTLEATKIPLEAIMYWKVYGEQKTELGLKKRSGLVDAYAASKGVVVPKQLEERKIDNRYIALVYENGQLDLAYACLDTIKEILPQYEYDRVQVKKPEAPKPEQAPEVTVSSESTEDTDVVAAFEKLEKLKRRLGK